MVRALCCFVREEAVSDGGASSPKAKQTSEKLDTKIAVPERNDEEVVNPSTAENEVEAPKLDTKIDPSTAKNDSEPQVDKAASGADSVQPSDVVVPAVETVMAQPVEESASLSAVEKAPAEGKQQPVEDAPVTAAEADAPPMAVVDEKVTAAEEPPEQVAGSKRGSAQELQDKLAKQLQKEEEGISAVDHIGPKEGAMTKVHTELRHKLEKQAQKAEMGEAEPGVAEEGVDEDAAGDEVLAVEGVGVEGVQAPTGQA